MPKPEENTMPAIPRQTEIFIRLTSMSACVSVFVENQLVDFEFYDYSAELQL